MEFDSQEGFNWPFVFSVLVALIALGVYVITTDVNGVTFSDWIAIAGIIISILLTIIGWVVIFNPIAKGITSTTSKLDNIQNTLPLAVHNRVPAMREDGQAGPFQSNQMGHLLTDQGTYIFGEDSNNNVMRVQVQGSYGEGPITQSSMVKSGSGQLLGFVVNASEIGASIKIFDSETNSGIIMFDKMSFAQPVNNGPRVITFPAAVIFGTGCYFELDGTLSVTPIIAM